MSEIHREYVDGGNRVKFTRSAVDGHITVRTWDEQDQRWSGYTVIGPAEVRDLIRWINLGED
jgi:hypothetical protein